MSPRRSGSSYFKILGLPEEEFPSLARFEDAKIFTIAQKVLKDGLKKTSYAISTDETRYVLNGILFSFKDNKLTLVATDGRRLTLVDLEVEFPRSQKTEIIVPAKAFTEIQRLVHEEGEVKLSIGQNQIAFELNRTMLVSTPPFFEVGCVGVQIRVVPIEADAAAYPHAAQLTSVAREVTHKASGKIEQGCRYFATSLRPQEAGPERLSHQIRGYWGVENIVHWRRDVLCREDKCRLRNPNAACILALLRTALITLVRCSGYDSLKVAQEIFAHDPNKAIRLLCSRRLI